VIAGSYTVYITSHDASRMLRLADVWRTSETRLDAQLIRILSFAYEDPRAHLSRNLRFSDNV